MHSNSKLKFTKNAILLLIALFLPTSVFADAIFPSLVLVWPIAILLFIPVVLIETSYAKPRLGRGFWEVARVTTVANLISAIAGLPIAHLLSSGLKFCLESIRFSDVNALRDQATQLQLVGPSKLGPHDTMTLMWLGLYPRWIMITSAVAMMVVCYFVSWWIEGKWLRRHILRSEPSLADKCMDVAKTANLLSYAFLTVVVIWALLAIWPSGMNSILSGH